MTSESGEILQELFQVLN